MKVKKNIFTYIIIIVCLLGCLFTCKTYEEEEIEYEYTNVIYSPDINSVTIYLDGQVPVPRSLNREIALMGCDYFEVTFMYQETDTTTKVARGEWMAGRMASVSGVERGVDYGRTSAVLTAGQGSAILFAGKSDKTLMAIGSLYMVNGAAGTTINTDTKSVTFRLAAISASAATAVMSGSTVTGFTPSSFKTSAKSTATFPTDADVTGPNTDIVRSNASPYNVFHTQNDKCFPLFRLECKKNVKATYTFDLYPLNSNSFDAYSNGIFISTPAFGSIIPGLPPVPPNSVPAEIERKQPRYTDPNGTFHQSILMLDEKTVVMLENNNTPNTPFEPVVKFSLYTELTVNGSVFSLVFSIPVYALREFDDNNKKSRWYIRSSYGPSLYDLDDGTQGMGGAVLIGTGEYSEPDSGDYTIRIETPPYKWRYNLLGVGGEDRVFNIDGLIVELMSTDGFKVKEIPYAELVFRIGVQDISGRLPTWAVNSNSWTNPGPSGTPYVFPNDFYGCIEISVEYYHTNKKTYYASFYLLIAAGVHAFYDIPATQIAHIYNWNYPGNPSYSNDGNDNNDAHAAWDTFNGGAIGAFRTASSKFQHVMETNSFQESTIVIIVHNSFNITSDYNVNTADNASRMYFIVAADENNPPVYIGRNRNGSSNLYSLIHNMKNPGLNAYYFGVWPFKENTIVPVNTKSFTVNTGGAYNGPTSTSDDEVRMIRNNNATYPGSGMYNVKVNGATILPTITDNSDPKKPPVYTYPLLH